MTKGVLRRVFAMDAVRRIRARTSTAMFVALAVLAPRVRAQTPAARPPVPGAPAGVTAFVNVNVIPMDTERVLASQTVLVERGWITALGPTNQLPVPAGATRIDGRGRYLLPGLSDCHTHLTFNADSAESVRRLLLYVLNGVTTVRNLDYLPPAADGEFALRLRARAAAGELWSPRIYTSGYLATPDSSGLAAYRAAGYDFIKLHTHSSAFVDAVAPLARRLRLPIAGHVPNEVNLRQATETGYSSFEHLLVYVETYSQRQLTPLSQAVALTKAAGVWNCATQALADIKAGEVAAERWPEARYVTAKQRQEWATVRREPEATPSGKTAARRQTLVALQAAGAGLLLGSDSPVMYLVPGFGVHRELAALVRAGLTPYQALATGTRNMAAYLGALESTGTVAVSKRADLVLLAANPLKDIQHTQQIAGVMVGGRWLARAAIDRHLATIERVARYRDEVATAVTALTLVGGKIPGDPIPPALRHLLVAKQLVTETQMAVLRDLQVAYAARQAALIDTLSRAESSRVSTQRLLTLVAQYHGIVREILTPAQQGVFDELARSWVNEYTTAGYQVRIPGV